MASLIENMAPEYTTDGAKAGNYYMHSKLLYLCKSDCSGLFDESNFEQVYLSDLLRGTANSNLGGIDEFFCLISSRGNSIITNSDICTVNGNTITLNKNATAYFVCITNYSYFDDSKASIAKNGTTVASYTCKAYQDLNQYGKISLQKNDTITCGWYLINGGWVQFLLCIVPE